MQMPISVGMPLEEFCLKDLPPSHQYCIIAGRSLGARLDDKILCQNEKDRLYRFSRREDFDRYLVAHNLIHIIFGQLLGRPAKEVSFTRGIGGKPLLQDGAGHFNLSHSGAWVGVVVSLYTPVGIDIEQPSPSNAQIPTGLYVHPNDRFDPETAEDDVSRFFAAWTLKEAISKCDGRGLGMPFDKIRLEANKDNAYRGFYDSKTWSAKRWTLTDGTHLAYAGEVPCFPLHILVT